MTLPLDTDALPEVDENVALSAGMADVLAETVTVGDSPEVNDGVHDHDCPGWMLMFADALAPSLSWESMGVTATITIMAAAITERTPNILLDFILSPKFSEFAGRRCARTIRPPGSVSVRGDRHRGRG